MSNKRQDKDGNILHRILKLLKLETTTKHGRVNLAFVLIVTFFCIIYTANDTIEHFISSVEDVAKTIVLKENISQSYHGIDLIKAVIPIILIILLCMLYIFIHEKTKEDIISEQEKK